MLRLNRCKERLANEEVLQNWTSKNWTICSELYQLFAAQKEPLTKATKFVYGLRKTPCAIAGKPIE
jgi:hypothetical protein